ncbi:LolA family protein [Alkalispirochaeta americana]|nr:outer membrane lipoprotein carrier protein LolA [Alkalispirochaeta americana]
MVFDLQKIAKTGLAVLLLVVGGVAAAQDLLPATAFFDQVAQEYGSIEEYSANISIKNGGSVSRGVLLFKNPERIRIDFSQPEDQVIVSDGERLQIYLPRYNVVLSQRLQSGGDAALTAAASGRGLQLLRRGYGIAYLDSPNAVPLEEGSDELVTKLRLNWRSTSEGFRQLILSIGANNLIRRIEGVTADYQEIQLDFTNIDRNPGIPASRFDYRGPSSANTFHDFLFEGEG